MVLLAKRCAWLSAGFLLVAAVALLFMRLAPGVGFPLPLLTFAFCVTLGGCALVLAGIVKALSYVR